MTEHGNDIEVFRRPFYFVICSAMAFMLPPAILVYALLSDQLEALRTASTLVLFVVLWVMMLACSIPLLIDYRRYQVRLINETIELQGWRTTRSMPLAEVAELIDEPVKLVIKDTLGKRRLEISTVLRSMGELRRHLESACSSRETMGEIRSQS